MLLFVQVHELSVALRYQSCWAMGAILLVSQKNEKKTYSLCYKRVCKFAKTANQEAKSDMMKAANTGAHAHKVCQLTPIHLYAFASPTK